MVYLIYQQNIFYIMNNKREVCEANGNEEVT